MWFANFFTGLNSLIFIVFFIEPWCSDAFNVETKHYTVYRKENKSMFGFAVSLYRDSHGQGWAIVGAPEADGPQGNVPKGGAVYKCNIAADDQCQIVPFDVAGNNHVNDSNVWTQIDNKSFQWFGATVSASSKDGGPILACAPRYTWFTVNDNQRNKASIVGNRREPVGTCWVINYFNNSQEFSPCRTRYSGYHRQGWGQAGLGAAISKDGETIFIGAPGSWYWQGQAFSQSLNSRSKLIYTKEGPATEDDSYMGYSVTTGDFIGNGDSGTAVGVPRGSDLLGKVILFTSSMTNPRNITGDQMGAYFGYAIASGDIDGDGLDDLIVGAPMYTIADNPEMTIETGKVYVIYQGIGPEKFRKSDSRNGKINRGRFGLSLSSLGDIDRDGYGDFVVGAPYGGTNGRGAVYIYHGSPTGVSEKYSQVIHAEDLDVPVNTFGFSVAGGLDLDGNRYPDLVIGAYESDTAMFFRSRPVIKMDSFVSFDLESKLISLDDKNCTVSNRSRVTCFPLRACFKYSGEGTHTEHSFNVKYILDVKKTKSPRLFFLELEGRNTMNRTIMVGRNQQFCHTVQVYVTPNIRDKLTSLDAEMRLSLDEKHYDHNRSRNPRITLWPILGSTTSKKDSLSIRKNCGADNVCIPDLQMNVTSNVHKYLLGSGKRLQLDVLVQNMGEDAFEATYNLQLPTGIDYINVEKIETMGVPVQCSAPKQSNNNTLRCDIGNPLPKDALVKFKVLLQPVTSLEMKPIYKFTMNVNTTNPEDSSTSGDNTYVMELPIWIETDLRIIGESKPPEDLYYNPDNYTSDTNITMETELGPALTHNYTIRNQGPSDVIEAEAFLIWPAQTLAGDELLYLLEQPETSGPIACEPANANYLSLKLDQRRRMYSHHSDPSGVILEESQSGRTINVQQGFDVDKNNQTEKEESEINLGDSSNMQKSRHSSIVSSKAIIGETRKFQISDAQNTPGGLITTYVQNNSRTSSINTENLSPNNRHIVFHTGSSVSGGHTPSLDMIGSNLNKNDERYQESFKQQELERQGEMERILLARQQAEEQERLYYKRRQEEEQIRIQQELKRQQEEEQIRKQQAVEQKRMEEEKHKFKQEKFYGSSVGGRATEDSFITDDRKEAVQRLEQLFGSLLKSTADYKLYNKQGKYYIQFMGRFRSAADSREYIELQNGPIFPLQDRFGKQSYISESTEPRNSKFLRLEGELLIDSDRKEFVILKDGRKFSPQQSFTHTEEQTYTLNPHSNYQGSSNDYESREYSRSWNEQSNKTNDIKNEYESRYSNTHEERWATSRTVASNTYGRDKRESFKKGRLIKNPNLNEDSRVKGEDDMIDLKRLRRIGELYRIPRDLENYPMMIEDRTNSAKDLKPYKPISLCDTAKCAMLRCVLGPLKKDEEVWIGARYRVNVRTLKNVASQEKVKVSTKLTAQVTKQPFIGTPAEPVIKSHEIKTNVEPSITSSVPDIIPLWVVVLSACAGTIILLLLIFLLHKCGFFKRNRPSDAPERQPLNRNGHFHAEDH